MRASQTRSCVRVRHAHACASDTPMRARQTRSCVRVGHARACAYSVRAVIRPVSCVLSAPRLCLLACLPQGNVCPGSVEAGIHVWKVLGAGGCLSHRHRCCLVQTYTQAYTTYFAPLTLMDVRDRGSPLDPLQPCDLTHLTLLHRFLATPVEKQQPSVTCSSSRALFRVD